MTAALHAHPRILVVEDEAIVAFDIQENLSDLGYEVAGVAASAEEATQLTSERRPDLVLMDIHLQGDTDGIAAAHALRARFGVAVVFLTAHGDAETIERARRSEPLGYLLKPFKKTELYSAVQIALSRHQMEQQLRARERLWATTLRSIGEAVITTDATGNVAFVNPAAESVTGWSQGDAYGRPLAEVLRLKDERTGAPFALPLEATLRDRSVVRMEAASLVRRDGSACPIADSLAPVVDGESVSGVVMVFRDVSEERRNQQRLESQGRLALLGSMAAGVAHEINNPLAFVTSNLGYVAEELKAALPELPPERRKRLAEVMVALEEARDGAQRVATIVSDLKEYSRPVEESGGGPARADVQRAMEWAVGVTEAQWKHRARIVRQLGVAPAAAIDQTRLGQVLVNLLVNAAQAIEPGNAERNEIRVRTLTDTAGRAVMEVEDTGSGMTPQVRAQLFTPFFTTKHPGQGTGLGLSICLDLVQGVGGEIEVRSELGRGTTFRVLLPPALESEQVAPLTPSPPSPQEAEAPRGNVLAIDDEPAVLRSIERALRGRHAVTCAPSAREALALIQAAGAPDFDVILCDLMMPEMTGMAFFQALQAARPALAARVMFLTGGVFTEGAEQFVRAMTNLRVDKPFQLDGLRRLVADAVVRARRS